MGTPTMGAATQFAVDAVTPFDANSQRIEVVSWGLRKSERLIRSDGLRGTRSHHQSRVRKGPQTVHGPVTMHPVAAELDWFLPYILGGATSSGVTTVADALPAFVAMADKGAKVFTYHGCRISRATLRGSVGSAVQLSLDVEAQTESVADAGTFPTLTLPGGGIFTLADCTLTLDSTSVELAEFALTIDNVLDAERFVNSNTRSQLPAKDRIVTLAARVPFTSTEAPLYDIAVAGVSGVLVIADGDVTYTIDFANLKTPAEGPIVQGREEIFLPLQWQAFATDDAKEIIVTKT